MNEQQQRSPEALLPGAHQPDGWVASPPADEDGNPISPVTTAAPNREGGCPPEQHEALSRDGPRIYVASLSDYNAGILHGEWIEADGDVETMQAAVGGVLRTSPTAKDEGLPAEQWAIHDFDGFGELRLGEHESLDTIARLARGIREHGEAFAAWASYVGHDDLEQLYAFEERFEGEWDSVKAFAEEQLEAGGAEAIINAAPEWLQSYLRLDVAGFARDLELGGDIITVDRPEGGVWVWRGW